MKVSRHIGFTLLELLIVIGIMGLLGTVSVSGFRGIRNGMEQRATMQVVNEFVRAAYRRAIIDRVPTAVYFWNETISDENIGAKLVVVGRAVAVRRAGRITKVDGDFLIDEFGDLKYETYRDEEGEEDTGDTGYQNELGRYLYRVGDSAFQRSVVSSSTVRRDLDEDLVSDNREAADRVIRAYAYYVKDPGGITWKVGDPYGFEFAELTLPKNFIFESSYSSSATTPEKPVKVLTVSQNGVLAGGNVTVSGLHLDKSGTVAFKSIGATQDPSQKRN